MTDVKLDTPGKEFDVETSQDHEDDMTIELKENLAMESHDKEGEIKRGDNGEIDRIATDNNSKTVEIKEGHKDHEANTENAEEEGLTRTKSQHQLDVDEPIEDNADKEPDDKADQDNPKEAPYRTSRLCRNATFITPPRAPNPLRRSAQDIDNQNAAISALISQQHDDLFEQTQRTKEIIAAVRRNIRNSIQNKRQEQLARQSKHLPVVRQNIKMTSVNLNEFSRDLPKQGPRILIPSKRRAKRWRIKLPPLDKYNIKKSGSMDFR